MTDRRALGPLSDDELVAALTELGDELAMPPRARAGDDPALRARQRIEVGQRGPSAHPGSWAALRRRPLRRSLVLALVALLALAAVAAAIGFGVPGIRIVFAPQASADPSGGATASASARPTARPVADPSSSVRPTVPVRPPASGGLLGSGLGLGTPFAVADASTVAGLQIRLPPDPPYGAPAAAWSLDGRVSLVWPASDALPTLREPGIGLILAQFRASINPGFFEKILQPGTEINAVVVDGEVGWWISGAPHDLIFIDPSGEPVFDSHRIVGDTLIWARRGVTYRLESDLDRAAATALAVSLR
ncbi:MAG: hypothetical protein H0U52_16420 [Chloroflexi bacterium]|nr:hypothetical protein [Chloroflexota bacterium]